MDRMSMHLRHVRCPTCWRVFCCIKHRVEHEHHAHITIPMAAPSMMIRRRCRPKAMENIRATTHFGVVNNRKRRHASFVDPAQPAVGLRMLDQNQQLQQQQKQNQKQHQEQLQQEQDQKLQQKQQKQQEQLQWQQEQDRQLQLEQQQQEQLLRQQEKEKEKEQQQQQQMNDVVVPRTILVARRSSLSFVKNLRPVAESSPMVPLPGPSTPSQNFSEPPAPPLPSSQQQSFPSPLPQFTSPLLPSQIQSSQLQPSQQQSSQQQSFPSPLPQFTSPLPLSQIQPSQLQPSQLPSSFSSQLTQTAPVPPGPSSPPRTPYASTPALEPTGIETPVGSAMGSPPSFYQTPMQTMPPCPDPTSSPPTVVDPASVVILSDKKRPPPSSNNDSTTAQKSGVGFFWSNMARRFRLALRPAKPKVPDRPSSPAPSTSIAKCYDNIQPRRPISDDATFTPVHARPSLEAIRRAHEEASKVIGNILAD